MRVAVYWNLHKKCFSVQSREGENYGRVVLHADCVLLRNVLPKVRETGRQRVLSEGRKNVHAFLIGDLVDDIPYSSKELEFIKYNPYRMSTFCTEDGKEFLHSDWVQCLAVSGRPTMLGVGVSVLQDIESLEN